MRQEIVDPKAGSSDLPTRSHVANNYAPLPVVIRAGEGSWVTDVAGRRYLDLLAGYSALNFGHRHPALVEAARGQLDRVTLTSRAFQNDQLTAFCMDLADLVGKDLVLPMNSGAEAVETAIKVARRWAYVAKGVPADRATIVVAEGNFHGRTISIVSFSTDPTARGGFGPFTPGFRTVRFGDLEALAAALDNTTAAVLLEPIQGEAGVIIPPRGYLAGVRRLCDQTNTLFIADEVQSGLCRTGRTFACDHEDVQPDVYLLGKALGGGITPISAVLADRKVLDVIRPGEHGSTFGGNPLACAVGRAVIGLVRTGHYQERARELGRQLAADVGHLVGKGITAVRCRGLWAGIDIDPAVGSAREVAGRLAHLGVLCKDTHGITLRWSPPLGIEAEDLRWAVEQLEVALAQTSVDA